MYFCTDFGMSRVYVNFKEWSFHLCLMAIGNKDMTYASVLVGFIGLWQKCLRYIRKKNGVVLTHSSKAFGL